jgi:hypothetical protein
MEAERLAGLNAALADATAGTVQVRQIGEKYFSVAAVVD